MNENLYIFLGDDDYLVTEAAKKCIESHLPRNEREFGLEIIYGSVNSGETAKACVDNVISSLQTPSFAGGTKVTWLKNALFLPGGGKVAEYAETKEAVDKLESFLVQGVQSTQILIITAPKLRKNATFFKNCTSIAKIEDFGSDLKSRDLEGVARRSLELFVEQRTLRMNAAAREEFIQRAGTDTRTIVSELEKLSLYTCEKDEINIADVREIVTVGKEAEAWDVLDAFGSRDPVKLIESIERMSGQGSIAIMLCVMIERTIRSMLVLREAYDRKWIKNGFWQEKLPVEVSLMLKNLPGNYLSTPTWLLKKNLGHALNFSLQELRTARFRIIELREKLVSTGQPELFLLQIALLRIIQRKKKHASAGHRG
jgi:DNA polymerase III subunit delta